MAQLPYISQANIDCSTKIELSLSARNLPKKDLNSPSDPFAVIYEIHEDVKPPRKIELAKTEVIDDNSNPEWTKEIQITYRFEEVQLLQIDIYDGDNPINGVYDLNNLSKHDYIGTCRFIIADLITSNGQKLAIKLKDQSNKEIINNNQPSICIVRGSELEQTNDEFHIHFSAKNLPRMNFFGHANPFLRISRLANDGGWASIAQSEHVSKTDAPKWRPMKLLLRRLCNNDYSRHIRIECFSWNQNAEASYMGELITSVQELIDLGGNSLNFYRPKKNNPKELDKSKHYGQLIINKNEIIKNFSFLEYIMGGLAIQLMIAIDFTGSNGDPSKPGTLHYMGPPNYESEYMKVIKSVGRVLEPYDSDNMIPTYGFGANLTPNAIKPTPSHCFAINFNLNSPELHGINEVINYYRDALTKLQLYGPTNFSEIIQTAHAYADQPQSDNKQCYTILLIITDGIITDMLQTCDAIVDASSAPLSIIIVGVGDADFSRMDTLDADDTPLIHSKTKQKMKRDIVQFVPFNKADKNSTPLCLQGMGALAKKTLEELPDQVTSYYKSLNLGPIQNKSQHVQQQKTMLNLYDSKEHAPYSAILQDAKQNFYRGPPQQQVQQQLQQAPQQLQSSNLSYGQIQQQQQQQPLQQQQPMFYNNNNNMGFNNNMQFIPQQQQQQPIQQQPMQQQQRSSIYSYPQGNNSFYGASAPPPSS